MARFDVFELRRDAAVLALEIQADLFQDLRTTIIVPLRPRAETPSTHQQRVNPVLPINDQDYIMVTTDLGVIQRHELGRRLTNVEADHRDTIMAAVDFLLTGF